MQEQELLATLRSQREITTGQSMAPVDGEETMAQNRVPRTLGNPISILGATMAVFSIIIIVVLLLLNLTGTMSNPYTGILAFMVGPAVLVLGLILIPVGVVWQGRHPTRGFPVINLNDPYHQQRVGFFLVSTFIILLLMAVTTWEAAEFMESMTFCGQVCHEVMEPEAVAHADSPHARVACVNCHIGPGAEWFVRSKISGINQVFAVAFNNYERPIPTPLEDLRPARGTCEECHWPEHFHGTTIGLFVDYARDEQNTESLRSQAFRVGGARAGRGIHWHTAAEVWYLPGEESRLEISWVRVRNLDGSVVDYADPAHSAEVTPDVIQRDSRFMDCIDCHNRASHRYPPVEELVDQALYEGVIDKTLPYIKDQAMNALGDTSQPVSSEQYQQALQRVEGIPDYYQREHADIFASNSEKVQQAVEVLKDIYQRSIFPRMNVTPSTYVSLNNHTGCFRCHGKLVGTSPGVEGQMVSNDCQTCHLPAPEELSVVQ